MWRHDFRNVIVDLSKNWIVRDDFRSSGKEQSPLGRRITVWQIYSSNGSDLTKQKYVLICMCNLIHNQSSRRPAVRWTFFNRTHFVEISFNGQTISWYVQSKYCMRCGSISFEDLIIVIKVGVEILESQIIGFLLLLARPSQDVFQPPLIPWIKQGGSSILLIKLLCDLCNGLTILC